MKKLEQTVQEVLETNQRARNDNFVLVLDVYKRLEVPTTLDFRELMLQHKKYKLPSFEGITRARRKVVENHPELQACEEVQELREEQEQMYFDYAIGG